MQALNNSTSGSNNDDTISKTPTEEQSGKDDGLLDELLITTKPEADVTTVTTGEAEPEAGGPEDQPDVGSSKIAIEAIVHDDEEMETVTVIFSLILKYLLLIYFRFIICRLLWTQFLTVKS